MMSVQETCFLQDTALEVAGGQEVLPIPENRQ